MTGPSTHSSSTLVAIRKDECFLSLFGHALSVSSLLSYLGDWLFYIALTTLALVYSKIVTPLFAEFYLYDTNFWHTHVPTEITIVPTSLLIIYSIIGPIFQFGATIGFTTSHSWHRRLWDFHAILLTMMASHAMQTVMVSLLKNLVGAPRPDMLARCNPDSWARPQPGELSNVSICRQKDVGHLEEGFRSFPSAHTSTAFTTAIVQVLFFVGRTRMLDCAAWSWKLLLSLVPLLSASAVAFSRITDNRHHVFDVLIGILIGLLAGYLGFIHHFPMPTFANMFLQGRAYSPRRLCGGSPAACWSLGDEKGCLRTRLFKAPKCLKGKLTVGCGTELCSCNRSSCKECSTVPICSPSNSCATPGCIVVNCEGAHGGRSSRSGRSHRSHRSSGRSRRTGRSSRCSLPTCSDTHCTGNCQTPSTDSTESTDATTTTPHGGRCVNSACTLAGCLGMCRQQVGRTRCATLGCTVANCVGLSCIVERIRTCRIPWCRNERCRRLAREHAEDTQSDDDTRRRRRRLGTRRVSRHAMTP